MSGNMSEVRCPRCGSADAWTFLQETWPDLPRKRAWYCCACGESWGHEGWPHEQPPKWHLVEGWRRYGASVADIAVMTKIPESAVRIISERMDGVALANGAVETNAVSLANDPMAATRVLLLELAEGLGWPRLALAQGKMVSGQMVLTEWIEGEERWRRAIEGGGEAQLNRLWRAMDRERRQRGSRS